MVNVNALTLFYSKILYLTYYFQTYNVCITTTTKNKSKTQHKIHSKVHICTFITFIVI
jgi:hypothetical protein